MAIIDPFPRPAKRAGEKGSKHKIHQVVAKFEKFLASDRIDEFFSARERHLFGRSQDYSKKKNFKKSKPLVGRGGYRHFLILRNKSYYCAIICSTVKKQNEKKHPGVFRGADFKSEVRFLI